MRRSNRKDRLQPQLSHKIQSKLLISSKQISTLSANILSKIDHIRNQEDLQRQYNLKFMTDRKKKSANQRSQKSLSSSKVTHKEHKQPNIHIIPQRLDFQTEDYRQKYYNIHDEYVIERCKNVQHIEKSLKIKEALFSFLSNPDSRSAEQLAKLVEYQKFREPLRRAIEQRRRADAGEAILKEAMKILQVDSWEEVLHNLRTRVERFRNLDECTFKILELESINKRVVNDFEEKLKKIRVDHEQGWQRERYLLAEDMENLKRAKECGQLEMDNMRRQFDHLLNDLKQLANSEAPRLVSNRSEVGQLQRLINSLRSKLQDIEVEAEDNIYKLLKSNEEMVKFQRNIEHLRGEMEQQMEELQAKNEQNQCEINHLNAQLAQYEQQIERYKEEIKKKQAEKSKCARENEDQWSLLAATLGVEQSHPAKLLLKIKDNLQKTKQLSQEKSELKTALRDKDQHNYDLQAEILQIKKTLQEVQQTSKIALYQKQQYKFLLNNLRDQVSEMKRQHNQEKSRIVRQKDEQIIRGNQDILESHESLSQQLTEIRGEYARIRFEYEQAKTSLGFYKKKAEQQERQLIQKEGVVKKFVSECDRYKSQLREIEGSFKEVVQLQEITSKRAIALDHEKNEQFKLFTACKERNLQLEKSNFQLNKERNQLKTELSKTANDLKDVKDHRNKCESLNVELRLQALNKQSEITKLEERLKHAEAEGRTLKLGNEKLMSEVNAVTRKLIVAKAELRKKLMNRFKTTLTALQQSKKQLSLLKLFVKSQLSSAFVTLRKQLSQGIQQVKQQQFVCHIIQTQRIPTSEAQCQCSLLPSDLKERINNQLLSVLTTVSLLRGETYEVRSEMEAFQFNNLEHIYRGVYEEMYSQKLKELQGSIEMIKEESQEQSEYLDQRQIAKIISPEEIFNERSEEEVVNSVLQGLLDDGEIPALPYWQKIETNYLAIRRKLAKRGNLKLDISAIDARDPSITSPRSSFMHQSDLIRGIGTESDDIFDPRETNREERLSHLEYLKKENEQLKARNEDLMQRLSEDQQELQTLRGKLVKLQNQTSIVGLQHNFRKIIEYMLADNVEFFLQSCRIVMKMLHFSDLEIKDFQRKAEAKRKKKKSGFFTQFFKI